MLRKALLTVAVILVLCGVELQAQNNTTNLEAYAHVMKPIILERTSNLNFGAVTVGAEGGNVVIAQNGNRSKNGDVALLQSSFGAANVTITAQELNWVMIDLPGGILLSDEGSNTLNMVLDPSLSGYTETGVTGILNMQIGGTVYIPAATPVGEYSGSVLLSVVYY